MASPSAPSPGTPMSPGHGQVSESLDGLVGALDSLKRTLGYGDEFALVEQHLGDMRKENRELRAYAEQAIREAQRLKELNEDLESQAQHQQLEGQMGAALNETAKLIGVADGFERDVYEGRLAEAHAQLRDQREMQRRMDELEEENQALTQTLNELRQSTQQLQRLKSLDAQQQQQQKGGGAATTAAAAAAAGGLAAGATVVAAATISPGAPSAAPSLPSGSAAAASQEAPRPAALPGSAGVPAGGSSLAAAASLPSDNGARAVAEQLMVATGGSGTGVVASAVRLLQNYAVLESALEAKGQESERLHAEVQELTDTMTGKTFKAPSAWAEREVKYKQDKRSWEEQQKELADRLAVVQRDLESYRGASKAPEFEERIQDLEARLVQSEREKDSIRAQLHEMQLSLRREGEFGNEGRLLSPYHRGALGAAVAGTAAGGSGEVHHMVSQMESARLDREAPRSPSKTPQARSARISDQASLTPTGDAPLPAGAATLPAGDTTLPDACAPLPVASAPATSAALAELARQLAEAEADKEHALAELRQLQPVRISFNVADAGNGGKQSVGMSMADADAGSSRGQSPRVEVVEMPQPAEGAVAAKPPKDALLSSTVPVAAVSGAAAASALPPPAAEDEGAGAARALDLEARLLHFEEERRTLLQQLEQLETLVAMPISVSAGDAAEQPAGPGATAGGAALEAVPAAGGAADIGRNALLVEDLRAQLRQAEVERQRVLGEMQALQPVTLKLAVGASAAVVGAAAAASASPGRTVPVEQAEQRAQEAELRLLRAVKHKDYVLAQMQALQQQQQQAAAAQDHGAAIAEGGGLAGLHLSEASLVYSPEKARALAADAEAADVAWQQHTKSTDAASLLRAKAELEARCELLEAQVAKMAAALEAAGHGKASAEDHLDSPNKTGDAKRPSGSGVKDRLQKSGVVISAAAGSARQSLRGLTMRRSGNPSPTKDHLKTALNDANSQLHETEAERNLLRRQLAKLSKKQQPVAAAAGVAAANAAALAAPGEMPARPPSEAASAASSGLADLSDLPAGRFSTGDYHVIDDTEVEVSKLRSENEMLMEHLVSVKIRSAEVHGDYLEARRELLRTREKQLQLVKKLNEIRAGSPVTGYAAHSALPAAMQTGGSEEPAPTSAEKRRSFRMPGLH